MIIVERPPAITITATTANASEFVSFDWSDFPLLGCDMNGLNEKFAAATAATSAVVTVVDDKSTIATSSPLHTPVVAEEESSQAREKGTRKKYTKKVSWDEHLDVRAYSLVVGDHPCCRDALPIQLGWDYVDESDHSLSDLEQEQQLRRLLRLDTSKYQPKRLTYMERKHLLQHVSGWTEQDLLHAISSSCQLKQVRRCLHFQDYCTYSSHPQLCSMIS